jgi:hypothetical protein
MTQLPPYGNSGFLACFLSSLLSWFWFGVTRSKFFLNEPLGSQPVVKVMTMIAFVLLVQLVRLRCDPLSEFSNVNVAGLLRHFFCDCFSSHNFLEKEVSLRQWEHGCWFTRQNLPIGLHDIGFRIDLYIW